MLSFAVFLSGYTFVTVFGGIGKDPRDYTERDLDKLFEQWEENEEKLPPDEEPEYKHPERSINFETLDFSDEEAVMATSKKWRMVMAWVTISGNPTKNELETISRLWTVSLKNAHMDVARHIVGEDQVVYVFKDGSRAWEAKNFLIQQPQCKEVSIDGVIYNGIAQDKKENERVEEEVRSDL